MACSAESASRRAPGPRSARPARAESAARGVVRTSRTRSRRALRAGNERAVVGERKQRARWCSSPGDQPASGDTRPPPRRRAQLAREQVGEAQRQLDAGVAAAVATACASDGPLLQPSVALGQATRRRPARSAPAPARSADRAARARTGSPSLLARKSAAAMPACRCRDVDGSAVAAISGRAPPPLGVLAAVVWISALSASAPTCSSRASARGDGIGGAREPPRERSFRASAEVEPEQAPDRRRAGPRTHERDQAGRSFWRARSSWRRA